MLQRAGRVAAVILAVMAAGEVWAQGCSMCGSSLQQSGDPLAQSISRSVVLMASMPFALFVTVAGWLVWKLRGAKTVYEESPREGTDA
jgi:hypothetical protein